METIINNVLSQMQNMLDPSQLKHLAEVLRVTLLPAQETSAPQNLLALFLTAKEVEGCSPKTIAYYESTLQHMTKALAKPYTRISSDDLPSTSTDMRTSVMRARSPSTTFVVSCQASSHGLRTRIISSKAP